MLLNSILQQDEWAVCRIFQKSVGLKKYPTNQYSRVNPYSLNNIQNASISPQMMMQLPHDRQGFQFAMGRNSNYMNSHGDIQDFNNRVIFQSGSSNLINNFPNIQPQMSYNIGGGDVVASSQPILRQQEVATSMMANCAITSYGGEMNNNANNMNSGVMEMDHCADLDNYWTTY